jgi:hypothetical protein
MASRCAHLRGKKAQGVTQCLRAMKPYFAVKGNYTRQDMRFDLHLPIDPLC